MRIDKGRLKELACVGIPISFQESISPVVIFVSDVGYKPAWRQHWGRRWVLPKYDVCNASGHLHSQRPGGNHGAQNYGAGKLEKERRNRWLPESALPFSPPSSSYGLRFHPQTMIGIFNRILI